MAEHTHHRRKVERLEEDNAPLAGELREAGPSAAPARRYDVSVSASDPRTDGDTVTRRGLLSKFGGVVVVGAAGVVAGTAISAGPAAAANGDPLTVGQSTRAESATELRLQTIASDHQVFRVKDTENDVDWNSIPAVIVGYASSARDDRPGVRGFAFDGEGVIGQSQRNAGVLGLSNGNIGVHGGSIDAVGVLGESQHAGGILGLSQNLVGVEGRSNQGGGVLGLSQNKVGVEGRSNFGDGVHGESIKGYGVVGHSQQHHGAAGQTTAAGKIGIIGTATSGHGVYGAATTGNGVTGICTGDQPGVNGYSPSGTGVEGSSTDNAGVYGLSINSNGVSGKGGGYGGHFEGTLAAVRLSPQAKAGKPTTNFHRQGELVVDSGGTLFFCTADGTPGTWKRVSLV